MLDWARTIGKPPLESAALNALTTALFYSHRLDEMEACAGEALRAAGAAGSEAMRVETMQLLALKHLCYGELREAKPLLDEVIRIARSIDHKPALLKGLDWRGTLHFFQSEYERAEELLGELRGLASELRDGFSLLAALFMLGLARGNMGRMSEALAVLHEAMEMAGRNGDHFRFPRLPNSIGWVHRELQDFGRALEYDRQSREAAREHHVLEAEANSLINLGYDHMHLGGGEKPLALFREVEAIVARGDWMRWRYNIRLQAGQAEYWLAQGDPEQAEEYARRLLETATHHEAHKYIAVAHKLLAEVAAARGDVAGAEAELQTALAELASYPVPIVAWKTYAALGRLHSRSGEDQAARASFAQAAAIVRQIAASVNDEKLRATFLNSAAVREVVAGANGSLTAV